MLGIDVSLCMPGSAQGDIDAEHAKDGLSGCYLSIIVREWFAEQ